MESADPNTVAYEQLMFGDPTNNQVHNTRVNNPDPQNWHVSMVYPQEGLGAQVSKLNSLQTIGPNMLLKVMAGDKLQLQADYFYNQTPSGGGSNLAGVIGGVIANILGGPISPGSSPVKVSASQISNNLGSSSGALSSFLQTQNNSTSGPKAYLNYLFFDENFRFIQYDLNTGLGSYGVPVGGIDPNNGQRVTAFNVKVPRNGYAFVYLSNASTNIDVYFDNFDVIHQRGRLVEENAYYPYGLKAKGICGKAFGKLDNKYGYQGEYAEEEEETGWDEYDLRMYDPQIGRWTGIDPHGQFGSPYLGMGNDPANNIDRDGGISIGQIGALLGAIGGGIAAHYIIKNNPNLNRFVKTGLQIGLPLVGAGIGYAAGESLANLFADNDNRNGTPSRYRDDNGDLQYDRNGSSNFWVNFKQFYVGLVGATANVEIGKNRTADANGYKFGLTPDINIWDFRNNNLPDWDYWRWMKHQDDPDFRLSKMGRIWRRLTTNPESVGQGIFFWSKYLHEALRAPTLAWYLYWLIHKPKNKGLSPFGPGWWNHGGVITFPIFELTMWDEIGY